MPEVIIIVAIARNNVIGRDGKLPWHLPSDLRHFKQTTMGYPLIMGRKTFDSVGRPLPGRDNIVLSRDKTLAIEGCLVMHSLQEALDHCSGQEKIFIIGGGDIFNLALPLTDTIIVTALEREVEGDVLFEPIDTGVFKVVEEQSCNEEEPYRIIRYERIRA
jgi:dihydrofolate reductase